LRFDFRIFALAAKSSERAKIRKIKPAPFVDGTGRIGVGVVEGSGSDVVVGAGVHVFAGVSVAV
jgi:hypothetical protein